MESHATLDIIVRARRLLDSPESWIQGDLARDAEGSPVSPNSPVATCWCLVGAISAVSTEEDCRGGPATRAIIELEEPIEHYLALESWNDCSGITHQDVIQLMDEVIHILDQEVRRAS